MHATCPSLASLVMCDKLSGMTLFRARNYAHDNYEDAETVEHLTEPPHEHFGTGPLQFQPWPEEVARQYVAGHNPGYEIGYEFTYDPESDTLAIEKVWLDGKEFFPRD